MSVVQWTLGIECMQQRVKNMLPMKTAYCAKNGCQEKRVRTRYSSMSILAGASVATLVSVKKISAIEVAPQVKTMMQSEISAVWGICIAILILTVFFGLHENFENWYTAFLFGISAPGLIFALASLGSV